MKGSRSLDISSNETQMTECYRMQQEMMAPSGTHDDWCWEQAVQYSETKKWSQIHEKGGRKKNSPDNRACIIICLTHKLAVTSIISSNEPPKPVIHLL